MWTEDRIKRAVEIKTKTLQETETKLAEARTWTIAAIMMHRPDTETVQQYVSSEDINKQVDFILSCREEARQLEKDVDHLKEQIKVLNVILGD